MSLQPPHEERVCLIARGNQTCLVPLAMIIISHMFNIVNNKFKNFSKTINVLFYQAHCPVFLEGSRTKYIRQA